MTKRLQRRILLVGHACGPSLGSEPGLTWNWARHLANHHRVHVITHPQHRAAIEAELAARPCESLRFHFVERAGPLDRWEPARGDRGLRFHYFQWQARALDVARELHGQLQFDLAHHVSWASINYVPQLWRLGTPFVWGPIGGAQVWPATFRQYAGRSVRFERFRKLVLSAAPFNPRLARAVRHATLICASNPETAALLRHLRARRVEMFFDNGIQERDLRRSPDTPREPGSLLLLWGGRCIPLKALPLALEAMAMTGNPAIRLIVAGDGPMRGAWEELARRLDLADRVQFLGTVPRARMFELFASTDALVFTSLRESTGSVVLEAMSQGLPIVTLDHQGIGGFVPCDAGIKVPVTHPRETIGRLAEAMRRLADNPAERSRMADSALATATAETWERRAERMSDRYEEAIHAHRHL